MPGEHTIRISAPGYLSWEKRVAIESGVSREFWNVILPHATYPADTIPSTRNTEFVFPHPTEPTRLALIKRQNQETSLVFYQYRTGETRQVFSYPESYYDPTHQENLEWSWFDSGRYVILPLMVGNTPRHFVIDATNGSAYSLEERFGLAGITNARWETDRTHELLFMSDQTLYRFNVNPGGTLEVVSDTILTYSLSDNTLYILMDTGEVWRAEDDRFVTITPPLPLSPATPLALTVYDNDHLAVRELADHRRLWLIYPNPEDQTPLVKYIAAQVAGMQFSDDGKKLLFFSENEIGVAYADEWVVQPRRKAGEIVQVARFSDAIKNVRWAENYEHIIFSRDNVVKFIELDGRDYRMIGDLQTLPQPPIQIFPLYSDNRLFFVVPDHDITSIVFPEPQGLFGQ